MPGPERNATLVPQAPIQTPAWIQANISRDAVRTPFTVGQFPFSVPYAFVSRLSLKYRPHRPHWSLSQWRKHEKSRTSAIERLEGTIKSRTDIDIPEWRENAIRLTLDHAQAARNSRDLLTSSTAPIFLTFEPVETEASGPPPTLYQTILRMILPPQAPQCPPTSDPISLDDLIPLFHCLPTHIRISIARYCAIYRPLEKEAILSLCTDEEGALGCPGELVIAGDVNVTSLLKDLGVVKAESQEITSTEGAPIDWEEDDRPRIHDAWNDPSPGEFMPLHTLVLLRTPLGRNLIRSLPLSLTHVALLAIPAPHGLTDHTGLSSILYLPNLLPSLVLLDISYNPWARERCISKWDLRKWSMMEILGVRGCGLDESAPELKGSVGWAEKWRMDLYAIGRSLQIITDPLATFQYSG